jgi:hypothetical protein
MSSSPTANEKNQKPPTPPLVSLISGGGAGGAEDFITYPFEFAKTRVQLGGLPGSLSSAPSSQIHKKPIPDRASHLQSEGLRALYKGCGALVTGSVSKDAVRFLCFDTVKNAFKDRESGALRPWRDMLAGMTAGVVTSVCRHAHEAYQNCFKRRRRPGKTVHLQHPLYQDHYSRRRIQRSVSRFGGDFEAGERDEHQSGDL